MNKVILNFCLKGLKLLICYNVFTVTITVRRYIDMYVRYLMLLHDCSISQFHTMSCARMSLHLVLHPPWTHTSNGDLYRRAIYVNFVFLVPLKHIILGTSISQCCVCGYCFCFFCVFVFFVFFCSIQNFSRFFGGVGGRFRSTLFGFTICVEGFCFCSSQVRIRSFSGAQNRYFLSP